MLSLYLACSNFSPQQQRVQLQSLYTYKPRTVSSQGRSSTLFIPDTNSETDTTEYSNRSPTLVSPQNQIETLSNYMQSESWGGLAHLTTKPEETVVSHHRESSLSSLGSTGPVSPYIQNTTNPYIALAEPVLDSTGEMHPQEFANSQAESYYQLAKSLSSASNVLYYKLDGSVTDVNDPFALEETDKKSRLDHGLLPAPELSAGSTKSHQAAIISQTKAGSPARSAVNEEGKSHRRRNGYSHATKLDRTMTDVYGDELYNPNFSITSTSSPQSRSVVSIGSDVFSQRINAANHQHLSAAQSPASPSSRAKSPFRTNSPFSTSPVRGFAPPQFPTSQQWREPDQSAHRSVSQLEGAAEPETPKTISPKDAILEFNEPETDWIFPLFPQDPSNTDMETLSKTVNIARQTGAYLGSNTGNIADNQELGYLPSQISSGISVSQQYPFVAKSAANDSPPRLSSSGASSIASGNNTPTGCRRPVNSAADSGTYTCTYHGCTLRFETPISLQKHKRECHRQTQGHVAHRVQDLAMSSHILNSQAGPHRCDRVNPSTGKPCNTIFSRPYDLTRHEDTIHNARKRKVRCSLCTEEKTFSRADALTRHYRVCHPDMELPGKTRRRGGA